MLDFVRWVVSGILPPKGGDADAQYRWQVAVASSILVWAGGVVVVTALAFGLVTPVFPGFARATDIASVQSTVQSKLDKHSKELDQIIQAQQRAQITALETEIETWQDRKCKEKKQPVVNEEAIDLMQSKVSDLLNQYWELTNGQQYHLLSCEQQ